MLIQINKLSPSSVLVPLGATSIQRYYVLLIANCRGSIEAPNCGRVNLPAMAPSKLKRQRLLSLSKASSHCYAETLSKGNLKHAILNSMLFVKVEICSTCFISP